MKISKWLGGLLTFMLILEGCIEPYDPPLDNNDINLLVVDGFLDATAGIATVSLSRTLPVNAERAVPVESGAQVFIEDGEGAIYPLAEDGGGTYEGPVPNANSEQRYRLMIRTRAGNEYISEFVTLVETPAIDSVTWAIKDGGVEFYVTTHDPSNASRYYRWKYVETYEYTIDFNSLLVFEGDEIVARPPDESIFTCWTTTESTDIILGSTQRLNESVVSRFPVAFVRGGSIQLRVRYSLLVQQQALTEDAYAYWLNLEKNTEHLGGLFDPLPSEVSGNIRSLNSPSETVIGFFGAGTLRESRMFLNRRQLPEAVVGRFTGNQSCVRDTLGLTEVYDIHKPTTLLLEGIYAMGVGLIGYSAAPVYCADCRTLGGVTTRPTFWD